ncbi:MAG TPA: copper amine oxidase N-terminal domain-containing protein, partial [Patescibacteria group bacterium]
MKVWRKNFVRQEEFMLRRIVIVFNIIFIIITLQMATILEVYALNKTVKINSIDKAIMIDCKKVEGVSFVPLRSTIEALGWAVEYNPSNDSITCTKDNDIVVLNIGSIEACVDDQKILLDKAPVVICGMTYIQSKAIAELFGIKV